jgi:hypothetical protein
MSVSTGAEAVTSAQTAAYATSRVVSAQRRLARGCNPLPIPPRTHGFLDWQPSDTPVPVELTGAGSAGPMQLA